jgi:hypothetical protein
MIINYCTSRPIAYMNMTERVMHCNQGKLSRLGYMSELPIVTITSFYVHCVRTQWPDLHFIGIVLGLVTQLLVLFADRDFDTLAGKALAKWR